MKSLFIPCLINLLVPLTVTSFILGTGPVVGVDRADVRERMTTTQFEQHLMFVLGLGILVMVPVFKTVTHLPPFMGVLFGLGILWLVGDLMHRNKEEDERAPLTLVHALTKIDMGSIVFFIGILPAVATLEHTYILARLAQWLDQAVGCKDVIVMLIGLVSSVVDNLPLVAASMGMYDLTQYPADSFLWAFMAYCAGTGGSILIIGSAAGVAAMGMEKIDFFGYVKRISGLALIGYLGGAFFYIAEHNMFD